MKFAKTLAEAMAQMKEHNCAECDRKDCEKHTDYIASTAEEIAAKKLADEELGKRLATEKSVKVTIEMINNDGTTETIVHDGFCMAGLIITGDDLEGGFEAMNIATGAFSVDRLEAVMQGLEKLQEVLKGRKVAAMLSEMIGKRL